MELSGAILALVVPLISIGINGLHVERSLLARSPMTYPIPHDLRRRRGARAERRVCRWLRWRGYRVLCTNVLARGGELDIVAVRGGTLHLIEVKARLSNGAWEPAAALTQVKRRHLVRASRGLLARLRLRGIRWEQVSFDVAVVQRHRWLPRGLTVQMEWDAFRPDEVVGGTRDG